MCELCIVIKVHHHRADYSVCGSQLNRRSSSQEPRRKSLTSEYFIDTKTSNSPILLLTGEAEGKDKAGEYEEIMHRLNGDDCVWNRRCKRAHESNVLLRGNTVANCLKAFAQHQGGQLNVTINPCIIHLFLFDQPSHVVRLIDNNWQITLFDVALQPMAPRI
jgi:hypothetical protein